MPFNVETARAFLETSNEDVDRASEVSESLKNISKYSVVAKNIEDLITISFGVSVEVQFYGSRVIGVATEKSDLDVFVKIDGRSYQLYVYEPKHIEWFNKLAEVIRSSGDWHVKNILNQTPVPVIFTKYLPLQLDCDINILNALGTEKSKLMAHLFEIQPEAVKLFHFVSLWLKVQGFDHFEGYLKTLLIIFYLQTKGCLPSGEDVHRNVPKMIISGIEAQFDPSRSLGFYGSSQITNYKSEIKGFFKFYADFDFSTVMSTFDGKACDVEDYTRRFPTFIKKGIFIAGFCNRGKNCGAVDQEIKANFISLCQASSKLLDKITF